MTAIEGVDEPGTDDAAHGPLLQIGQVAALTGLSLKTIRHYDELGLIVPSARSAGGFRLYARADVERLLVVRRMKPLGFTLEEMRDLLEATDRLASPAPLLTTEQMLRDRVVHYQRVAAERCEHLRKQLSYAEDFAATLRTLVENRRQG